MVFCALQSHYISSAKIERFTLETRRVDTVTDEIKMAGYVLQFLVSLLFYSQIVSRVDAGMYTVILFILF